MGRRRSTLTPEEKRIHLSEYCKKRVADLIARGKCINCGRVNRGKKQSCLKCRRIINARWMEGYNERKRNRLEEKKSI